MTLRIRFFSPFLAAFLLAGCAMTPLHRYVPAEARDKIASTDAEEVVPQSEIYVFVPDSQVAAATGGGLLEALIDVGINKIRTSKAETTVRPLRDAMVDYNFDKALQTDLQASLSTVPWLHAGPVHIVKDGTYDNLNATVANPSADAVLLSTTDYQLSNDANTLKITINAFLFPKSAALLAINQGSGPAKVILKDSLYHNTLILTTASPYPASDDRDSNIARLSANNGAAMRAALTSGAAKLADLLAADIQFAEGGPDPIATMKEGIITRDKNGALTYVASSLF